MQVVRNIKTGLEFPVTADLVRFAKNPRNNLEVIEVEDEQTAPPTPPVPPAPTEPPAGPTPALDDIKPVVAPDEAPAPAPDTETAPTLPLEDSFNDGFAPPPPLPKKK